MKHTITAKLVSTERLNNSVHGNPRYWCELVPQQSANPMTLNCGRLVGRTASDAMFAYNMPSPGGWVQCTYHTTKTGRVVFDSIKHN